MGKLHSTVYLTLCNYIFSKSYQSNDNQIVLDTLVKEVKALNPEFSTNDIRGKFLLEKLKFSLYFVGAAYRFYRSNCEVLQQPKGVKLKSMQHEEEDINTKTEYVNIKGLP